MAFCATNAVEIKLGEETKYNGSGFGAASPADHSIFENSSGASSFENSFMALQVANNLHTSVQLEVKGNWVPIYVDPDNHIGVMDKQLTPLNEYMLFWNNKVQTSSMIDSSRFHEPFTFSFKGSDKSKTVRFGYAVPEKPSGSENAKFYDN
ncbi:hypothetical protein CGLO_09998 [Colletotrichum gloeosporioides Cg-14]|uniref:Uncharacterized protein n=1 Tax=Colletotrichum gloeosporioides (strain Cg-14) TaxID=1237896 RepID=T0LG30_COLGC|nr:hypothetical protein CGLO_09998 [Colletotrichum gloeosporioides Cg-14]